ncbi:phytanoyl-CoA dioxygenase family protein [Plantactinospora sp. S1510]|uniref:Phytanoyl-CoA dioxygenase family protein n=1 Tax=Plantactinospora alkalitolerans TaxID=2789879 RepID=A0ABS0H175_9ACTN|nr:phytanoyl-CoA dioxygenase family protein [Plantactinospora alkalitolerans]MBF9132214.1 phytanoyl-CoA dioxygenase family protein [Plantactinospora alkalitolerans]
MRELRRSADLVGDADAVRKHLVEDGYVYLPGFLDVDPIVRTQELIGKALVDVGWVTDPVTLTAARPDLAFTSDSFATVYPAVQRVEQFHRVALHPRILRLVSEVLDGEVFCHPARVLRVSPPSVASRMFTRAHQDFVVLHVATDVLTAWIPFTPTTPDCQGLRLIPGSHLDGFLPTDPAAGGARPLYLPVRPDDPRWATTDYQLGDVVLFHSLMVHAGGHNTSHSVRLSGDVRYQLTSEPMRAEFAHPHGWPRTPDWPELTADWADAGITEIPEEVELRPMPTDLPYGEYLRTLTAPPSALLNQRLRRTEEA